MTDDDQTAAPVIECIQQPVATGAVQMIGRLIQHQQLRLAQQCFDQGDSDLLAAAEVFGEVGISDIGESALIKHLP